MILDISLSLKGSALAKMAAQPIYVFDEREATETIYAEFRTDFKCWRRLSDDM
jgi:hypothetical protein